MDNARAFCKRNFGDLVTIKSESEKKFLWKYVSIWLIEEWNSDMLQTKIMSTIGTSWYNFQLDAKSDVPKLRVNDVSSWEKRPSRELQLTVWIFSAGIIAYWLHIQSRIIEYINIL
jgi:hypothetical protein